IDVIVLSHIHGDHTGGLGSVLAEKRDVVAWVPVSFPGRFKKALLSLGVGIEEVSKAREIMAGVYTTGELGREIREQALVLKTVDGLVVITGCAHPGVVDVVRQAKAVTGEDTVYLVLGGFHLVGQPTSRIRSILRDLRRLSVRKVAPCHCSGDEARKLFKQEYGADYMECGVGRRITLRIR
ncbi:MAG: MBL fold metallo-hydrolase, partial [Deltaproteobacteria bacterium]|nr:MBL fold metallo-hydrolase [Deltaproteobacteria bacterium]